MNLFSIIGWSVLGLCVFLASGLSTFHSIRRGYGPFLFLCFLSIKSAEIVFFFVQYEGDLGALPLNPCDIATIATIAFLWRPSEARFSFMFLWGFTCVLIALIYPGLNSNDSLARITFFYLNHAIPIFTTVLVALLAPFNLTWTGLKRVLLISVLIFLSIFAFNELFATNYFYFRSKPNFPSFLDILGPWPVYPILTVLLFVLAWVVLTAIWTWVTCPEAASRGRLRN